MIPLRILILDDDEARHAMLREHLRGHDLTHAWNSTEATSRVHGYSGESPYDVVMLDHDLGEFDEPSLGTGLHVAREVALVSVARRPRLAIVHSHNPDGAAQMMAVLSDAGITAHREPFCESLCRRLARSWK